MIFFHSTLDGLRQANNFQISNNHVKERLGACLRNQTVRVLFPDSEMSPSLFQFAKADGLEDWFLETSHERLPALCPLLIGWIGRGVLCWQSALNVGRAAINMGS